MRHLDIRSEKCTLQDFIDYDLLNLPKSIEDFPSRFTKEEALTLLENPPINPITYFFDPDFQNKKKYSFPESTATIIQLFEILIACGHADWVCKEIPKRNPRIAILAALSGHEALVLASSHYFSMPELKKCLNTITKKRQTLTDIQYLSTVAKDRKAFRLALADAIHTYCLTCDVADHLMDPLGWFQGFERASPGKLSYFFSHCPKDYPILNHLWQHWAQDLGLPWGSFCHPRGHMLYTECYHYRVACIGEATRALEEPARFDNVKKLLREMPDRIQYYQSGSTEGFIKDTTKMIIELLKGKIRFDVG